jgi:hypothetical protein
MTHDRGTSRRRIAACMLIAAALCAAPMADARAHYTPYNSYPNASDASALSLLPVAVSVAAPVAILSAGAMLTVVAVEASAVGTVWVLERASDGARASVNLASNAVVGLGTAVMVTAVSAGWVLSAAGEAIAFIPNELGGALLYNERISR